MTVNEPTADELQSLFEAILCEQMERRVAEKLAKLHGKELLDWHEPE
jgi:hypothetical protein